MEKNYNINQISKTLDKLFKAGFNTNKKIIAMKIEDLAKIGNLSSVEMMIIIDFKKAVANRQVIAFLSGYKVKGNDINEGV